VFWQHAVSPARADSLPAASWHPSYAWQQFASFALIAASRAASFCSRSFFPRGSPFSSLSLTLPPCIASCRTRELYQRNARRQDRMLGASDGHRAIVLKRAKPQSQSHHAFCHQGSASSASEYGLPTPNQLASTQPPGLFPCKAVCEPLAATVCQYRKKGGPRSFPGAAHYQASVDAQTEPALPLPPQPPVEAIGRAPASTSTCVELANLIDSTSGFPALTENPAPLDTHLASICFRSTDRPPRLSLRHGVSLYSEGQRL
jgi:hypothetical protein